LYLCVCVCVCVFVERRHHDTNPYRLLFSGPEKSLLVMYWVFFGWAGESDSIALVQINCQRPLKPAPHSVVLYLVDVVGVGFLPLFLFSASSYRPWRYSSGPCCLPCCHWGWPMPCFAPRVAVHHWTCW
jgi:hypothetical protein